MIIMETKTMYTYERIFFGPCRRSLKIPSLIFILELSEPIRTQRSVIITVSKKQEQSLLVSSVLQKWKSSRSPLDSVYDGTNTIRLFTHTHQYSNPPLSCEGQTSTGWGYCLW